MPTINKSEMLGDIPSYLPQSGNTLSDSEMENVISNVISNQIPEDDEIYYSEALCKSLQVIGIMNNSRHVVDEGGLIREQVGKVTYQYSEDHQKRIWKEFLKTLPDLCPYLPKGGYKMPTKLGIVIKVGDTIKITDCEYNNNKDPLIL